LILWSHPPGSNRRPADYETIHVKSHLLLFFSKAAYFERLSKQPEIRDNCQKHKRLGLRADKTADKNLDLVGPASPSSPWLAIAITGVRLADVCLRLQAGEPHALRTTGE
jgi:hypothetical protein